MFKFGMAILEVRCIYSNNIEILHMEKSIKVDKDKRLPPKPPLLPKPKIILPPKKFNPISNIKQQSAAVNNTQIFESSSLVNDLEITDEIRFSDFSSVSESSFQLNDLDFSINDSIECDKETDSDFTDSASQRSIEAVINNTQSDNANDIEAFNIANELASTELNYIETLRLIVFRLKDYLKDYAQKIGIDKVIPDHEFAKIISSLPQLLSLNEDLFNDLKFRVDNWKENPKIADVIIKKGPFLKLYTTYIKEFETLCIYLDECKTKYPKFADAINSFESLPICKNLNIKHYMLKPVQRIPQYRLLLQNYLNHVKTGIEEHNNAIKALQIIHQVLNHTNDTLNLDNLSKLLEIQSRLGSYEIIKPGRKFLREGELYKLSRKEMQLRFFILLSDCLLYTTFVTLSILKLKYELPLLGMKVQTNSTEKYEFSIITSTRSFTLRARNSNEYCEWVELLQTAIEDNNKRQLTFSTIRSVQSPMSTGTIKLGQEAPIWIQDKRTTMCQICTSEFTMTFRRHHCRSCGKVVCSNCSNNRAPLAYLKFQCARVCKPCFDFLLNEVRDHEQKLLDVVKSIYEMNETQALNFLENLIHSFKGYYTSEKSKKFIPQRLKEVAGDELGDITISGWLMRKGRRGWKRLWFVLKSSVLYEYKASHDVVAYRSLPVLGYTVTKNPQGLSEEYDNSLAFSLDHNGQPSLIFMAMSKELFEMWVTTLTEATILK